LLPSNYRLRNNYDFRNVYRKSHSFATKYLVLYLKKNNTNQTRIGFSISKKIGKATKRNYLKRQLREIIRHNLDNIQNGFDLIFVARQKIIELEYHELEKNIIYLLKKGRVYINE